MKKILLVGGLLLALAITRANGEPIEWNLPFGVGTVQLPFQAHQLVGGLDFVLNDVITGYSTPIARLWKEIDVSVGAVGAFARSSAEDRNKKVEPYLGGGVDLKRHFAPLDRFTSLHINAFGRWSTERGKPGAGLALSYEF